MKKTSTICPAMYNENDYAPANRWGGMGGHMRGGMMGGGMMGGGMMGGGMMGRGMY